MPAAKRTRLTFFLGKGGVGKTTIAAAYGCWRVHRDPKERVILVSTDPAHSLADVFARKLGSRPAPLPLRRGALTLWQVDPAAEFQRFLAPYREAMLGLLEEGTWFSRAEIEPLLDTTLPGMAEVSSLLALQDLLASRKYDHVVVDTAPIGHTLRLFALPRQFEAFLDFLDIAAGRDQWLAQRFGGRPGARSLFLEQWRAIVADLNTALASAGSELFFVTTPESFSLRQMERSLPALPHPISGIVLNRAQTAAEDCSRCLQRVRLTTAAYKHLRRRQPPIKLLLAPDLAAPAMGAPALLVLGRQVFGREKIAAKLRKPRVRALALREAAWPVLATELSVTLGKGGVGKTTTSAALAFHTRSRSKAAITICSTDPAPSLDEVFAQVVDDTPRPVLGDRGLRALEIDSAAGYERWAGAMRERLDSAFASGSGAGIQVDLSFERRTLAALLDIMPPGVDEIFAVFRILDLLRAKGKALIDMAPTGHALELLHMPERLAFWARLLLKSLAPHRTLPFAQDAAVEIASVGQQVRALRARMTDRETCRAFVVTVAEPMPFRQTETLLRSLRELHIGVDHVLVNRVRLTAEACRHCATVQAGQWDALRAFAHRHAGMKILVLPEMRREIAGKEALQRFTTRLWRLA